MTLSKERQQDAHVKRWANYNWFDILGKYEKYQEWKWYREFRCH